MAAILKGLSINKGLAGYWPLGNLGTVAGNVAVDLSGRQNTGTLANGPVLIPGPFGRALLLNGTNQSVSAPNFSTPNGYTWCQWVRGSAIPNTTFTDQTIRNGFTDGAWGFSWDHGSSAFEQAVFHQDAGGGFVAAKLTTSLLAGVDYFICGTWDGTTVRAWLNGINQASVASGSVKTPVGSFVIGRADASTQFFGGAISQVRVYKNRALSAAELWQLYTARNPNFGLIRSNRRGLNSAAASTVIFRRSLSPLGTRVGSRQAT